MQVADRERLLHLTLPTPLFAQPRTNAPKGGWQGEVVCNDVRGLPDVAGGYAFDEVGDVKPRGASRPTGPHAVARMIGEQQFERGLARCAHFFGVSYHLHSLRRGRRAGRPKVSPSLNLYCAQKAGSGRLEALDVAERRDAQAQLARGAEDRGAGWDGDGAAVNGKREGGGHCGAKSEGRRPKAER